MNAARWMAMGLLLARIEGRSVTVAAAGMPPGWVHRQGSGVVEEVALEGVPLGSALSSRYSERRFALGPGDTLLLMTDGLPELASPDGEPYGYTRVRQLIEAHAGGHPDDLIRTLAEASEAWSGGAAPDDDMTFVALRVRPD